MDKDVHPQNTVLPFTVHVQTHKNVDRGPCCLPGSVFQLIMLPSTVRVPMSTVSIPSSTVRALMDKNVDSVLGSTPLLLGVTRDEGQMFLTQSDLDEVNHQLLAYLFISAIPAAMNVKNVSLAVQYN